MRPARALTILTGASRGLGAAIATQLLQRGDAVLTMSRRKDPTLDDIARKAGASLEQWSLDLADPIPAAARLEAWLDGQREKYLSVTLINNAALAGRPGSVDRIDSETLSDVLRVGLEAPVLLTSAFLRATLSWDIPRNVLNISSGAGRKPLAGIAAYCAVKAGLDHFSRVVALDEAQRTNPGRVVSLAPGVIDTAMQVELRESDPKEFSNQPMFAAMKANGELASPAVAATQVLGYLARPDFGNSPVADVRDR